MAAAIGIANRDNCPSVARQPIRLEPSGFSRVVNFLPACAGFGEHPILRVAWIPFAARDRNAGGIDDPTVSEACSGLYGLTFAAARVDNENLVNPSGILALADDAGVSDGRLRNA